MDSVTQFALGAGVGLAVLGPRIGPRRAALVGGVLGTLPDLDVFIPFDDPIDAFVQHRAVTHSLVVQAAATPLLGEALMRLVRELRDRRVLSYLAVYLCLATHALLDALTIYGTRIFWPLWTEPIGVGSVFIIDPLYTLPLIVALIWASCLRSWTPRFRTVLTTCLTLSTGYLGWSIAAQQIVVARATQVMAEAGIAPERMFATPTPFNTLFWRVVAIDGERYLNLYMPVAGSSERVSVYAHPRGGRLAACLAGMPAFDALARFSRGFYRIDAVAGRVVLSDLRMGLTPNYSFRYAIALATPDGFRPIRPVRLDGPRGAPGDLDWLLGSLRNELALRPAERAAVVELSRRGAFAESTTTC